MATPEPDQKRNPASTNRAPNEHAKLWRDPDLNNLELLHAHFLMQSFAPHTHETYSSANGVNVSPSADRRLRGIASSFVCGCSGRRAAMECGDYSIGR
jgi:hypothetical protein